MIEVMTDLPERVLGLKASGEVTAEDYRTVLVPAVEAQLTRHEKVRLLYVFGDEFKGYTGGAAWEDAKVGMKHLTSFERVAIVTDVDWIEKTIKAFGFAVPGEVRVFDDDDLEAARQWISEPPSQGHLSFDLNEDQGVLILQPKGELEVADFEPPKGQHFALRVVDLDAARTHLAAHGVKVSEPSELSGICVQSFFQDPTGNLIELNQPL